MERRGGLFVISGPSGVGKGSVIQRLLERDPEGLWLSVSVTTRDPRPGERDGHDYRFLTDAEFAELVARDALLEWAEVFGRRYGTPAEPVAEERAAGRDVILEIDVQGAAAVRRRVDDAVLIFLDPPSWEELERRLRGRGTEDEATIARRLTTAREELASRDRFDHVVVNDDLQRAAAEVEAIIQASRPPEDGNP